MSSPTPGPLPTEAVKRLRRDRCWAARRYQSGRLMFDEAYEQGYQDALADSGFVRTRASLADLLAAAEAAILAAQGHQCGLCKGYEDHFKDCAVFVLNAAVAAARGSE